MSEIRVDTLPETCFRIGEVQLNNKIVSAPMAGISDKAFRIIAENAGCGLVYTEMISATALHFNSERTKTMLNLAGEKGPTTIQIFGNEPGYLAKAAVTAEEAGAKLIDINMGCPAPKVVKNQEGCALMTNLPQIRKICTAVVRVVKVPITAKIRKGWDENTINAVETAKLLEDCGMAAVTVHGRTRNQFYSGRADWDIIRQVKEAVKIPVIGNGDVFEPPDGLKMLSQTGCDAVMIGRGALGNPWLFKRTIHLLETGILLPPPGYKDKLQMAKIHLKLAAGFKGELRTVKEMRKHLAWYIKNLRDSARVREIINKVDSVDKLNKVLDEYEDFLDNSASQP